ncbi:hypothetical protein T265_05766 [Opisthorchis viverrini]|uniref:Large ribosomal subunit protein mL64 n=1 Tax=Opisthorchis viverrini TaxID=6198 RepID=A0A074ZUY1_OPIVI|nr:hypothetical protein T265_05766 [Opisthorchis viverrini]KER27155.1 hypothetical protein T265_05766 [Opisthorchis viverrini]
MLPARSLTDIEYADNIALLGSDSSQVQTILNNLNNSAVRFGLRFTPAKCKVLLHDCVGSNPHLMLADDFQTFTQSSPSSYEEWNREWKRSDLPRALQSFDISRLPSHLKKRLRPTKDFFVESSPVESTLDYKRRLFGEYGFISGVDPSILFVDPEVASFESSLGQATERPIEEVLEEAKQAKAAFDELVNERIKNVKSNMKKMPELIEKHEFQKSKQHSISEVEEQKRRAILEEARDRFGYYLDPRDPKFIKLKQEIEEREKLAKKQQKKANR